VVLRTARLAVPNRFSVRVAVQDLYGELHQRGARVSERQCRRCRAHVPKGRRGRHLRSRLQRSAADFRLDPRQGGILRENPRPHADSAYRIANTRPVNKCDQCCRVARCGVSCVGLFACGWSNSQVFSSTLRSSSHQDHIPGPVLAMGPLSPKSCLLLARCEPEYTKLLRSCLANRRGDLSTFDGINRKVHAISTDGSTCEAKGNETPSRASYLLGSCVASLRFPNRSKCRLPNHSVIVAKGSPPRKTRWNVEGGASGWEAKKNRNIIQSHVFVHARW